MPAYNGNLGCPIDYFQKFNKNQVSNFRHVGFKDEIKIYSPENFLG